MASRITYEDKVALNESPVNEQNKVTADNMNEIKNVVNDNAEQLGRITDPTIVTLDDERLHDIAFATSRDTPTKTNTMLIQAKDVETGKILYLETDANNVYYVTSDGTKATPIKAIIDALAALANATLIFTVDSDPPTLLSRLNGVIDKVNVVSARQQLESATVNLLKQKEKEAGD